MHTFYYRIDNSSKTLIKTELFRSNMKHAGNLHFRVSKLDETQIGRDLPSETCNLVQKARTKIQQHNE